MDEGSKYYRNVEYFRADLNEDLRDLFNHVDIDVVFHFGGLKSVPNSVKEPFSYYDNNVRALINLLKFSKNVKKFIFASSCSVTNPNSPYSETKIMCEKILEDFGKEFGVKTLSLRYPNPIGSYIIDDKSMSLMNSIKSGKVEIFGNDYDTIDGTPSRNYIDVDVLSDLHLEILNADEFECSYYNIYSTATNTVSEIIDIFRTLGHKVDVKISPRRSGDFSKLEIIDDKHAYYVNTNIYKTIKTILKYGN